jgi:hypothetical protein
MVLRADNLSDDILLVCFARVSMDIIRSLVDAAADFVIRSGADPLYNKWILSVRLWTKMDGAQFPLRR